MLLSISTNKNIKIKEEKSRVRLTEVPLLIGDYKKFHTLNLPNLERLILIYFLIVPLNLLYIFFDSFLYPPFYAYEFVKIR